MRTASVMAMDLGDGMKLFVTLYRDRKVEHAGFSFEMDEDLHMAGLIKSWCKDGVIA